MFHVTHGRKGRALGVVLTLAALVSAGCAARPGDLSERVATPTPVATAVALQPNHGQVDVFPDMVAAQQTAEAAPKRNIAIVNGKEALSQAAFEERKSMAQSNLDGLRGQIAAGGPPALTPTVRLEEQWGVPNVALGGLILDTVTQLEAAAEGFTATDQDIQQAVARQRQAMAQATPPPGWDQYIKSVGEERYWSEIVPQGLRASISVQKMRTAHLKDVDPGDQVKTWTAFERQLVDGATVQILAPQAIAPATLQGARGYLHALWNLSEVSRSPAATPLPLGLCAPTPTPAAGAQKPVLEFRLEVTDPQGRQTWKPATATGSDGRQRQLTGAYLLPTARVIHDPATGMVQVELQFDDEGAKLDEQITSRNIGHRLGIFVDDRLISAPMIQSKIGGQAAIASLSGQDASCLVETLNAEAKGRKP